MIVHARHRESPALRNRLQLPTPHAFLRVVLVLVAWLAACSPASALDAERFTDARFRTLQAEGALILIDIAASWCPTCAQQQRAVSRYRDEHPDVPLTVLQVDYDTQKEWVKHFKAPRQSTLILYRGAEQLWFSVAETDAAVISAAIDAAAAKR